MAIFKCKMCGGDLNVTQGTTICECEFCGTTQTIPSADDERKTNLFNRANHLRRNNEFDRAIGVYESIIADFPNEAEAYWGLLLCKFGIEYVDDPLTGRKIATCHRTSYESILNDENYKKALEYADSVARSVYAEEANYIDEVQKGILKIANSEKPYDVFICYKETDELGERTQDSVYAQDIYDNLTEKGMKVFFARITLEDKLGRAYEPYIFAALNSAKVMVVLGTKVEYFNAVWVKNEWMRYLALMKKNKEKVLIPVYKNIDPYDLPEAMAMLQAQDMSKIGFMQDLVRGIKKVVVKDEKPVVQTVIQQTASANVENLLKRGMLALEDGKWDEADKYFENVLNESVEEARAYLGKLMVNLRYQNESDFETGKIDFLTNDNYKKIQRFGDEKLKQKFIVYTQAIIYNKAIRIMDDAKTGKDYLSAKNEFLKIPNFKDSNEKAEKCSEAANIYFQNIENLLENGMLALESNKWDEADNYFENVLNNDIEEARAYFGKLMIDLKYHNENDFETGKIDFSTNENYKKIQHYADEELKQKLIVFSQTGIYNKAIIIMNIAKNDKEYISAKNEFLKIPNFKDSNEKAEKCSEAANVYLQKTYNAAGSLFLKKPTSIQNINSAMCLYNQIIGYKDVDEKIELCKKTLKKIKEDADDIKANEINSMIDEKIKCTLKRQNIIIIGIIIISVYILIMCSLKELIKLSAVILILLFILPFFIIVLLRVFNYKINKIENQRAEELKKIRFH